LEAIQLLLGNPAAAAAAASAGGGGQGVEAVNWRNAAGETALHQAVEADCLAGIDALLTAGAEPSAKDQHGGTPMQAARSVAAVERLRAGGCVRDQRTTQYCAEAVRLQARVWQLEGDASALAERLTAERDEMQRDLRKAETECSMLRVESGVLEKNAETTYENHKRIVAELTAERDEARRIACAYVSGTYRKDLVILDRAATLAEAKRRGWDCFEEDGK
jgi:outer membrane murein-binding lipoprotein Lpp